MTIETTMYKLPETWACALINNDWSGLQVWDSEALTAFLNDNDLLAHNCVNCSDHSYFTYSHDAGNNIGGCNVLEYHFTN